MTTYGCHNRQPIQTFGAPTCQYTYTDLGQADKRCEGCKERAHGPMIARYGVSVKTYKMA